MTRTRMLVSSRCLGGNFSNVFLHAAVLGIGMLMSSTATAQEKKYAIVIHGGAGGDPTKWTDTYRQLRLDGLGAALEQGEAMLASGADALDVVEAVVKMMEDNETFNAGRGCVLNENGEHELDASIMDGRNLNCGAVAGVKQAKNPISLARLVMSKTRHVLLMGKGADEFGEVAGVELEGPEYFRTERKKASWQKWKTGNADASLHRPKSVKPDDEQLYLGTVGCAVLDVNGNLAAATSTGGLMGKRWGRVGDSPIIGAGNYADNETCAVSGTGIGEEFIRHAIAGDVAARMRYGELELKDAAAAAIDLLPDDAGGLIAVDKHGNVAMEFNTPGMSRAHADSSGKRGVWLGRENE